MGYGHQRAAFALGHLAKGGVINANSYPGIPHKDRDIWRKSRLFYEFVSRFKRLPLLGEPLFNLYDTLQSIEAFYPKRDLSDPTFQVRQISGVIRRSGWGKHLIEKLSKQPIPLICTFFVPALMAEAFNYPGEIYCLATDSDISRAWVPQNPRTSRIKYFAPTYRVADRLSLYGVLQQNIFMTGFPLPPENLGSIHCETAKQDTLYRLANLDPQGHFAREHGDLVKRYLGRAQVPKKSFHPLTLTFAVGGAGAQRDLSVTVLRSLRERILHHDITYIMVAGIHNSVSSYFRSAIRELGLMQELGKHVVILFASSKAEYFRKFNHVLRSTDILWSKPSELSFYIGLGIPLVMAPPIGSQEKFNKRWVELIGGGIGQEDPEYTHEWLFDWINRGLLAEAAMQGFIETQKKGVFNIQEIVLAHAMKRAVPATDWH